MDARGVLGRVVAVKPVAGTLRAVTMRGGLPRSVWHRLPTPPGPFEVPVGDRSFMFDSTAGVTLPRRLFWRGMKGHEPETFVALGPLMPTVRTFVDVGANVGLYSLYACAANPDIQAIAFEAVERVADKLRLTVDLSGFQDRIDVRLEAVSDRVGTVSFYVPDSAMPATAHLESATHVDGDQSGTLITVPSTTLDAALEGTKADLVKIDVEGAEDTVLRGATRVLAEDRPGLILEVLPEGPTAAIQEILRDAGYRFWALTGAGPVARDQIVPDAARKDRNYLCLHADDQRASLLAT